MITNMMIVKNKPTFKEHPEEGGQVEVSQDNLCVRLLLELISDDDESNIKATAKLPKFPLRAERHKCKARRQY